MLFYADDLVEQSLKVRNQIRHMQPNSDGLSCAVQYDNGQLMDEKFKQTLRENEGIYFDINISPNSPVKIAGSQVSNEAEDYESPWSLSTGKDQDMPFLTLLDPLSCTAHADHASPNDHLPILA
jgi:hypothetical protein